MWGFMNNMGNQAHPMGSFKNQRRNFSLSVEKVPIVPGKTFSNPNFVIKHHPSVHSRENTFIPIPIEKFSHCDSSSTNDKPLSTNSALINNSQSLVNTLKEHHLDTIKNPEPETTHTQTNMCSKKGSKRNHRGRRRRTAGKTSNQTSTKNYINDMMDVEIDIESSLSSPDISFSPKTPGNIFNLTDFIVDKPCKANKPVVCAKNEYDSDREDFVAIISVPPLNVSKGCVRERQVSVSESEDSFIMFQYGTDEELESTEESDTESDETSSSDDEEEEEEGEDEVDFAFSEIPIKRVRFAEDDDLCHVHNMVQWSYAYQQARKGHWEEYARDRARFCRKTADVGKVLAPILDPVHRWKVYRERFQGDALVN